MKQFAIIIISLFFFSFGLKAQTLYWSDLTPARGVFGSKNLTLDQIQGSPYLSAAFVNATVITSDGKSYKDVPLRYDCYDDLFEFKNNNVIYDVEPKELVTRAEFGGKVFCYLEYEPQRPSNKAYFQILVDGKAKLCVQYKISFYEKDESKGYADPKPDRFDDLISTYWISLNNAPAKKILNKKQLMDVFSDKKNEVENYFSNQKLSVKNGDDLKKIVNYYNSL